MKNGKFGFGIVGCGVIGPTHANGIVANNDVAELIAVADVDESKAKKMAEDFKCNLYYRDYRDLLKNKDIDIVNICTPSGLHGEVVIEAAKAGKHVIVEKPLEVTLKKCDAAINACRKNNVKMAVIFQRRTFESSKILKKAIEDKRLGKMILGDAYLKYYRSPEYYKSAGWRATWELDGGGALMNQGIHGIDLINWLMGGISSVYAYCETKARDIKVEDTAVVLVRYKNGALGVIEGTTSIFPGLATRFEISGDKGTVVMEEQSFIKWEIQGETEKPDIGKKEKVGGSSDPKAITNVGHAAQIRDMIEAIKNNREPLVNGEEGKKAVKVILAIYESSRRKKEVKISEE